MKRTAAAVLTLLFLLAACSPAPEASPTPTAAPTPSPAPEPAPTQLASSPWLEDYNYFWDVIEENYPFYHAVKRITGNDLAKTREYYLAQAQEAASAQELYTVLNRCDREFHGVGHFCIMSPSYYARHMNVYQHYLGDPKFDYLYARISTPATLDFYNYTLPSTSIGSTSQAPSSNADSGNLHFTDFAQCKASCVSVRAMTGPWQNDDASVLADYFRRLEAEGYTDCIVDIRGNGGGSNTYWTKNIVAPNISETLLNTNYALLKGPETASYFAASNMDPLPISELLVAELPALHPDDLDGISYCYRLIHGTEPTPDAPLFTGRFWLLVDARSYSASEAFAVFCKGTGFATLVGTPTGGDGIGIDPLLTALPNSGIVFRFSSVNGLNPDGSCNEEYGTTPDIVIEDGQDALTVCLEAISAEK